MKINDIPEIELVEEFSFSNVQSLNEKVNEFKGFLLMNLNIRSINKNFKEFCVLLKMLKHKPEIIICT